MERAHLDDDVDELAMLQAEAAVRYAVGPLPTAFLKRYGVPAECAFAICRVENGKVVVPPALVGMTRADAEARVARLNAPGRADGFHRWN